MDLEKITAPKIEGFKEITSKEFYNLGREQGLRIFDYYTGGLTLFKKKLGQLTKSKLFIDTNV